MLVQVCGDKASHAVIETNVVARHPEKECIQPEQVLLRRHTLKSINSYKLAQKQVRQQFVHTMQLATLMVDAEEIREQHAWVARLMNWMTCVLPALSASANLCCLFGLW